ncbi:MAG: hypothetical protein NTW91_08940 [Verrucomicrobia bacterium]|nr:hypothetical protein [Verrucomicrobiota bacterium]
MRKLLLILLGLAGILHAEEAVVTNAPATYTPPRISWRDVPDHIWGDDALPYAQAALKAWYQETDPKKKVEIGEKVLENAAIAGAPVIAQELLTGKPLQQCEMPVPTNELILPLLALKEWNFQSHDDRAVIRRIGSRNFELWTPPKGWLFDDHGNVLSEVKVPRRDGTGREWYGAFLPTGEWITTDLWWGDNRIYLFSPGGKLQRAFPTKSYLRKDDAECGIDLAVAWARADKAGTRWIAKIGPDGPSDEKGLLVSPWGWKQRLAQLMGQMHLPTPENWRFVEPVTDPCHRVNSRELGSRGGYLVSQSISDDEKAFVLCQKHGHGIWIDFPMFLTKGDGVSWQHVIPKSFSMENYGFFPSSKNIWVGEEKYPTRPHVGSDHSRSWIIDPDGKVLGWLPAERVGDDPDGKRMWFVDEQARLLKVAPDGTVSEVLQPTLPGATGTDAPFAHVLFPDLKLGFFYTKPGHLVLARWN